MSRKDLFDAVFDLVRMSRLADQRGEFGDLYPKSDELLDRAISEITEETRSVHESGGVPNPWLISERDGARLVVHFDLIHIAANGLETVLGDDVRADYRMDGDIGSIVVGKNEHRWGEIVEGLRRGLTPKEKKSIEDELVCADVLES